MNTQVIQPTIDKNSANNLQQPKELYNIFFIELWERFGYYGMQILLVFFITDFLHLTQMQTIELNGAFIALVYSSPIFGGFLADRFLGIKRTLMSGASLLAFGYFFLSVIALPGVKDYFAGSQTHVYLMYWALGIIAIGNGCFKPNPTSLLSKVYKENDPRIDAGYTIFYMSINIGSLCSLILTPIIHANYGYAPAFMTCGGGLILGLVYFSSKLKNFKQYGAETDFAKLNTKTITISLATIFAFTLVAAYLLAHLFWARILIICTAVYAISMFSYFSYTFPREQGNKILAILILLFFTAVFFSLQLQMFGVLNVFINEHVDKFVWGMEIPTGNFGALNALWVAVLGPIMAKLYITLEEKGMPFTIPTRFALGLFIGASAFYYLSMSSGYAQINGMISAWWIVISYALISLGEILVSALGLALICKLAPPRLTTVFYGAFLLSVAIGGWLSGLVGYLVVVPEGVVEMQIKLEAYSSAFLTVGHLTFVTAVIAGVMVPYLVKLTGEKHKHLDSKKLDEAKSFSILG